MPNSRGGKRPGAGRPKGSGKYQQPTKAIRVPESLVKNILAYAIRNLLILYVKVKISIKYFEPQKEMAHRHIVWATRAFWY